jgi:hypothetical protein
VAEQAGFFGWDRALFHIDEAMSWESVRNLQHMRKSLVLVRNLLGQDEVPLTDSLIAGMTMTKMQTE